MNALPILLKGDSVCLVSPSFSAAKEDIEEGIQALKDLGLNVKLGHFIFRNWGSFSGTDKERLADLQTALDSETAKAIICVRGGYGISRIIDQLDWSGFLKYPKYLVGFSDITLLNLKIQQLGLATIHGLMAARFAKLEHQPGFKALVDLLFEPSPLLRYQIQKASKSDCASEIVGKLIGGNLTMVSHAFGTGLQPDLSNAILFLEDVGEPLYRIDRMLHQIRLSGKVNELKAIVLGQFTDCVQGGFPLELLELVCSVFPDLPVFHGLESGHAAPNFPVVTGAMAKIEMKENGYDFIQSWNQEA